jgi:hypothetical protein
MRLSISFTLILLLSFVQVFGQKKDSTEQTNEKKVRFEKIKDIDWSDPWMVGPFELAPILELRMHRKVPIDTTPFNLVVGEVGLAFVIGDCSTSGGNTFFGQDTDWFYVAPFITGELRKRQAVYNDSIIYFRNLYNRWMLNTGVTIGGGSSYNFPIGINGTLGLSTDFDDLYVRTGVAIDLVQMSFGIGRYFNLTNNGPNPTQLSSLYFNFRFIWWGR